MQIEGVIFDMDGVAVDSEHVWPQVMGRFLQSYGIETNHLPYDFNGTSLEFSSQVLKDHFGLNPSVEVLTAQRRAIAAELYHQVAYVPGFCEFHNAITQLGIPTCIGTSADDDLVQVLEETLGIVTRFGGRVYPISVVNYAPKPNPDIYHHCAKELGTRNCLVVEDSAPGVMAAKNAGLPCLAIGTNHPAEKLALADMFFPNYAEIMQWLSELTAETKLHINLK